MSSPNEDLPTDLTRRLAAWLDLARGACTDYVNGRPIDDVFGELVIVLLDERVAEAIKEANNS